MSAHMLPCHDHPLYIDYVDHYYYYNAEYPTAIDYYYCCLCSSADLKAGVLYRCNKCDIVMHKECVEHFLDHPFQCNHFLKFFDASSMKDENHRCNLCENNLSSFFAWCKICNIRMDGRCLRSPPPLTISQSKHHKHTLTLLMRPVIFTCNACGLTGANSPYVCLECNLMVHKYCIEYLPRVIMTNRHDHRISHTFHLGESEEGGQWECGVCRKTIDWVYGAFKCSRCPNYAVHSICAKKREVWDGVELEDVPEEEEEEIEDPFKVVNEKGDIIHFTHEIENHILLRLDENFVTEIRCEGCFLPINGDPCFKCVECEFILHKACATLPREKRHLLHNHKLILHADEFAFECRACKTLSNGFRYVCCEGLREDSAVFDVRCSSVSEPFQHDLHPQHPLYLTLEGSKQCKACLRFTDEPLSCVVSDCDYALCMKCATLPKKVKHRCDDHFLTLSQGVGNASGDLWCDICETKTDPSVVYYTCHDCGLSLHIRCVLGSYYYLKVGRIDTTSQVLANNGLTRPLCSHCGSRCRFPFFMRETKENSVIYKCDFSCFHYSHA